MLRPNLISQCEKFRSNTSLVEQLSNDQLSQSKCEASATERTIEHFNRHQLLSLNYIRKISAGNHLVHSISTLLKTNLNCFSRRFYRLTTTSKMKDLLLNNLTENDILISEQRNNYANGISNGISNGSSKNHHIPKMAQVISGIAISKEIRAELKEQIAEWVAKGNRAPHLTAVLIGDDPASHTYVNNKIKAAADVGISSETKRLPTSITELELLHIIDELNSDDHVDGILVQLPVPAHINERIICDSVCCNKDVDGFNEKNVGRLCLDIDSLIPCTALGVQELIKRSNIDTFGKNVVVIGRSKNVGLPIFMLLHADGRNETAAMDATVTMCHRFTPPDQLKQFCQSADIIISATGVPGLVTADMVKPGASIIDVGITRVTNNETGQTKLVGDVDYEEVRKVAGRITPVPGGVGPMTVTMLMKNTLVAAKNLAKLRSNRNGHA